MYFKKIFKISMQKILRVVSDFSNIRPVLYAICKTSQRYFYEIKKKNTSARQHSQYN